MAITISARLAGETVQIEYPDGTAASVELVGLSAGAMLYYQAQLRDSADSDERARRATLLPAQLGVRGWTGLRGADGSELAFASGKLDMLGETVPLVHAATLLRGPAAVLDALSACVLQLSSLTPAEVRGLGFTGRPSPPTSPAESAGPDSTGPATAASQEPAK